jgi:antitoxin FitA
MAQLVVRDLEDSVAKKLKERAKRHARSMEDEVRHILRAAVHGDRPKSLPLGSAIASCFAGIGLDADLPELRGVAPQPMKFDE